MTEYKTDDSHLGTPRSHLGNPSQLDHIHNIPSSCTWVKLGNIVLLLCIGRIVDFRLLCEQDELSYQKYGVALFGATWVPPSTAVKEDRAMESETPASATVNRYVLVVGGGGGHRRIPHLFVFDSNSFPISLLAFLLMILVHT